jgi:AhpD family alkylhydroperoxidase
VTARRRACRGLICRKAASGLAGDDVSDTPLATQPKTEDAMEITTQTHLAALRDLLVYRQRELRAEIHAAALEAVDKGLRADALEPVLDIKDSAMQQSSVDVMSAQARRGCNRRRHAAPIARPRPRRHHAWRDLFEQRRPRRTRWPRSRPRWSCSDWANSRKSRRCASTARLGLTPIKHCASAGSEHAPMHVSEPTVEQLPWLQRLLLRRQIRRYGQVFVPALVWARVPALHVALTGFYAALERRGSPLPPSLRSLVQVRVSQINHCAFCVDLNAAIAAERAGSADKAFAVEHWRDDPRFEPRERAALEYAEAMTVTGAQADPPLIARLREHFDEAGLIELTALIAFQNLSSKFNAALDIPAQGSGRVVPRA